MDSKPIGSMNDYFQYRERGEISARHRVVYEALAREYHEKAELHRDNIAGQVKRFAGFLGRKARVLDLGCAVGVAVEEMLRIGLEPVGVDVSDEMIRWASERAPEGKFVCGDFLDIRFKELFDGIYAQSFIHLFPDSELDRVFERIRSALAARGVLFISTTESAATSAGWERKADYAGEPFRFRRHWTRPDFISLIRAQGFVLVDEWHLVDPFKKRWMIFIARHSER